MGECQHAADRERLAPLRNARTASYETGSHGWHTLPRSSSAALCVCAQAPDQMSRGASVHGIASPALAAARPCRIAGGSW
jgi:hypothetical protein